MHWSFWGTERTIQFWIKTLGKTWTHSHMYHTKEMNRNDVNHQELERHAENRKCPSWPRQVNVKMLLFWLFVWIVKKEQEDPASLPWHHEMSGALRVIIPKKGSEKHVDYQVPPQIFQNTVEESHISFSKPYYFEVSATWCNLEDCNFFQVQTSKMWRSNLHPNSMHTKFTL